MFINAVALFPRSLSPETDTYRFIGSFHFVPEGTALPTAAPTVSTAPSESANPTRITSAPTISPTISNAPTSEIITLTTPELGNSYGSAYGYMFDVVGLGNTYSTKIFNFDLFFQVDQCMFQIYTKTGQNYYGYNRPSLWSLVGQGNMTRTSSRTKFPSGSFTPQLVNPGETSASISSFLTTLLMASCS